MMRLKTREKVLLGLAGAIVIIFAFQKFFISGMMTRMKEIHGRIAASEVDLKENIAIQKRKDYILKESKNYQSYFRSKDLSDVDAVKEFLKEIENIAQESGVSIVNLNPNNEPVTLSAGYKEYNAELRIEAAQEGIFSFLNKIQSSRLLIRIDKFSITPKDPEASLLKLDTTISIALV